MDQHRKTRRYILGADEVGRGSLAGPVTVGAILVPEDISPVPGVADSKALTANKREKVAGALRQTPGIRWVTVSRTAESIDRWGIIPTLRGAFESAIQQLLDEADGPVMVRVDGKVIHLELIGAESVEYLIRGDALDWVIGAASILAKVERDTWMSLKSPEFPVYQWNKNKGYGSLTHTQAIRNHGLSPLHRVSFCTRFTQDQGLTVLDVLNSGEGT